MTDLPCMRDKCIGKACANFGERGCKGGEHPPWSWAKWYLNELNTNNKPKETNNERK